MGVKAHTFKHFPVQITKNLILQELYSLLWSTLKHTCKYSTSADKKNPNSFHDGSSLHTIAAYRVAWSYRTTVRTRIRIKAAMWELSQSPEPWEFCAISQRKAIKMWESRHEMYAVLWMIEYKYRQIIFLLTLQFKTIFNLFQIKGWVEPSRAIPFSSHLTKAAQV